MQHKSRGRKAHNCGKGLAKGPFEEAEGSVDVFPKLNATRVKEDMGWGQEVRGDSEISQGEGSGNTGVYTQGLGEQISFQC